VCAFLLLFVVAFVTQLTYVSHVFYISFYTYIVRCFKIVGITYESFAYNFVLFMHVQGGGEGSLTPEGILFLWSF